MGVHIDLSGSGKPREFRIECGISALTIDMNPIVFLIGASLTWGFAIWCMAGEKMDCYGAINNGRTDASIDMTNWQNWVTQIFNWFYIGSQDIWIIYIVYLFFSKFGAVKLGKEKPEFSDSAYFIMMFSAGVAVGLFFYGVTEPLYHKYEGNKNMINQNMDENEADQVAINLTMYHWGLHGWVPYTLVGITLAYVSYVRGMPMCIRSCLYPLLGDRIYGYLGDIIDGFSILVIISGVCTSLGMGSQQIAAGMSRLHPDYDNLDLGLDDIWIKANTQVAIVWLITLVATASVLSGVHYGIKFLSMVAFISGMFLLLALTFLGNTWFQLNLFTQSIGYYFQWLMQIGWHTDAFESLNSKNTAETSLGFALKDSYNGIVASVSNHDTNANTHGGADDGPYDADYMNWWTIFYWGWWIAWSPFVGTFIARISKGRTIREVISYSLFAPLVYLFWWFACFGGEGLIMDRMAKNLQLNGAPFVGMANGATDPLFAVSATVPECDDPSLPEGFLGQCVTITEREYSDFDLAAYTAQLTEPTTQKSSLTCPGLEAHLTPNCADAHLGAVSNPAADVANYYAFTEKSYAADGTYATGALSTACGHQFGGNAVFCESALTVVADLGHCGFIKDEDACNTYRGNSSTTEGIAACKATCFSCPAAPHKAIKLQSIQKCSRNKVAADGQIELDPATIRAGLEKDSTLDEWDPAHLHKTEGCSKRRYRYLPTTHNGCISEAALHQWVVSDSAPNDMRHNPKLLAQGKVCHLYNRIYSNPDQPFFDILDQFGDYGSFLCGLSIMSLIIYFCTSSDSGSLVIDIMAANGKVEASAIQRIFWSFTEAALATGLIKSAETAEGNYDSSSTKAFRAGSICCGLPFTVILCLMVISLHRALTEDDNRANGIEAAKAGKWTKSLFGGVFNIIEVLFSVGTCDAQFFPGPTDLINFFMSLIVPFVPIFQISSKLYPNDKIWAAFVTFASAMCYYVWIGLHFDNTNRNYSWGIAWVFYIAFVTLVSQLRNKTREDAAIVGNVVEDFFVSLIFYFQALPQMLDQDSWDDSKKDDGVISMSNAEAELDKATAKDSDNANAV
jgi:choline-glycine betaine transporter